MDFDLSPLWISLKTALAATLVAGCCGIIAARWLWSYQGRGKGMIDGLLLLPLVLPPTVVGFLLLLLLGRNSLLGKLLEQLGIQILFSWPATAIAAAVVAFPLVYKTTLTAFEQVDRNLPQVAQTLGASESHIFWQILLPLAWPGVVAGTILAFARALGEFGATLMLAGSIPGTTQTMPIAIFFAAEAGDMGRALNWVLAMVVSSLVAIIAINGWAGSQRLTARTSRPPAQGYQRLFDWLILGQTPSFPRLVDQEVTPLEPQFSPFSQSKPESQLWVEIHKHLPGFSLRVAFTGEQDPLGLLGASGSGKSMTLRCIAGLETPDQGRIILNRRVLFDSQKGINIPCDQRRVGFVFQDYALFPHLTVAQNISFGLQGLPSATRLQRLYRYLHLMQLQGLAEHYPYQLSGGQQQRVALARALAIEPDILLLDEPLSALDTYLRSQIEKLMADILTTYPGVTLFVTHKLEEVYRLCSDLLVLANGQVIAAGPKADIFERPPSFAVAQVTECKNFSQAQYLDAGHIQASDWGCQLQVVESIPQPLRFVGIRAHHLSFTEYPDRINTFPCWLIQASETQHRVTLYLRLHQPPQPSDPHHLQMEVYREKWATLKDRPWPWYVHLDPLQLILMSA